MDINSYIYTGDNLIKIGDIIKKEYSRSKYLIGKIEGLYVYTHEDKYLWAKIKWISGDESLRGRANYQIIVGKYDKIELITGIKIIKDKDELMVEVLWN